MLLLCEAIRHALDIMQGLPKHGIIPTACGKAEKRLLESVHELVQLVVWAAFDAKACSLYLSLFPSISFSLSLSLSLSLSGPALAPPLALYISGSFQTKVQGNGYIYIYIYGPGPRVWTICKLEARVHSANWRLLWSLEGPSPNVPGGPI